MFTGFSSVASAGLFDTVPQNNLKFVTQSNLTDNEQLNVDLLAIGGDFTRAIKSFEQGTQNGKAAK